MTSSAHAAAAANEVPLPADVARDDRAVNTSDDGSTTNISALRQALFTTLQGVKSGVIDVERARAINEIGKTLVDSARVEVDYLRAAGGGESGFIDSATGDDNLPPGITSVRRHRLGR